jgi:hypothetical protein
VRKEIPPPAKIFQSKKKIIARTGRETAPRIAGILQGNISLNKPRRSDFKRGRQLICPSFFV